MKPAGSETKLLLILGLIVVLGGGSLGLLNYLSTRPPRPAVERIPFTGAQFDDLARGARYSTGPANAPITVVEFADFQCPACRRAYKDVTRTFGHDKNVRLMFRHLPLPMHERAVPAAIAVEAAGRQKKFWEMYALLFDSALKDPGADLTDAYFTRSARKLGLDLDRFNRDQQDPAVRALVDQDTQAATKYNIDTTPTFLVRRGNSGDPTIVVGGQALKQVLAQQTATVQAGSAPQQP